MQNENGKRKYGHGENRKDGRLVMRMTNRENTKLSDLTQYLGKSRSEIMREALDMYYKSEGGDDIRNRPPKQSIVQFNLANIDKENLRYLSRELDEPESEVIRKAIGLYRMFKELD